MVNVTNNHDAPLNVAGTDVRPGATVAVDDKAFDRWSNGNAAKHWLAGNLIVSDKTSKEVKQNTKSAQTGETDREKLVVQANALGITFTEETSDEDLANAIAENQQDAAQTEREKLLAEARSLGLNPNVNTGTEKLKKLIAEKKGA